jgi:indolepyruvate ferredoxin oxidoreductase
VLGEQLSSSLTTDSYARATTLAGASEMVRGYEDVKLRNVEKYRAAIAELQG